ncbi:MAG: uroporphyrinogen decarboxylase family protein [Anaerolineae bacterium]
MNARERFQACMRFEKVDRAPNWEMGYWAGVLERWYGEGLTRHPLAPSGLEMGEAVKGEGFPWKPGEPHDYSAHTAFGLDEGIEKVACEYGPWPAFPSEILREDETTVERREPDGTVVRMRKDSGSLPHPLSWPVKDRKSWETLKAERLQADAPGRLPADWPARVERYRERSFILGIGGPMVGLFSVLRTLMGFETLMYTLYDDPELIHDMLAHLSSLWLAQFETILADTSVDYAYYWEDMSFKGGSMVSPRFYREFLTPVYQRINGFLRAHGIDIILLDTDGNVWGLIPLLLEAGVTGTYPFEVRAGMDVSEVRTKYPRLAMLGGIDKTALAAGKEAIDRELARVAPVIKSGGFIPACDHYVPPDVSLQDFAYYRCRLAEML